jgi:hypothetical protein
MPSDNNLKMIEEILCKSKLAQNIEVGWQFYNDDWYIIGESTIQNTNAINIIANKLGEIKDIPTIICDSWDGIFINPHHIIQISVHGDFVVTDLISLEQRHEKFDSFCKDEFEPSYDDIYIDDNNT